MPQLHVEVRLKDADDAEYIARTEVSLSCCRLFIMLMLSRSRIPSMLFWPRNTSAQSAMVRNFSLVRSPNRYFNMSTNQAFSELSVQGSRRLRLCHWHWHRIQTWWSLLVCRRPTQDSCLYNSWTSHGCFYYHVQCFEGFSGKSHQHTSWILDWSVGEVCCACLTLVLRR
jgi:hypothetical protein